MAAQYKKFDGDRVLKESLFLHGKRLQLLTENFKLTGVIAFAREGKKAKVYKATYKNQEVAMKVFLPLYALTETALTARVLAAWSTVPGLRVLSREVIDSATAASMGQTGLSYSVVMPWIDGEPWAEILDKGRALDATTCLTLARRTVDVLAGLEQRELVHADVSSSNVIIQGTLSDPHIELIDVEDMYHPSLPVDMPYAPDGSPGYSHPRNNGKGCRNPFGDRFAGAILLTEMLAWHDPKVRNVVEDISLFTDDQLGQQGAKFDVVRRAIARYSTRLPLLLDRAWKSSSLETCPALHEWRDAVAAVRTVPSATRITDLFDLTAELGLPSRSFAPMSTGPRPQTNLITTSVCPECGHRIPFRSPQSHAPTCSLHPSQSAVKKFLAQYLESQQPKSSAPAKPSDDLWDFVQRFKPSDDATSSSASKALPRYDDVTFIPIVGGPPSTTDASNTPPTIPPFGTPSPGTGRFDWRPLVKRPSPKTCDQCSRTISTVDGKEKGHAWTCRKGPLSWLWS